MKRLLLVLLFSAPLLASSVPVAEIYHVVNNQTGFNVWLYNDSPDLLSATFVVLDVNGLIQHIGPFQLQPSGGIEGGFGGFSTTGTFSVEFLYEGVDWTVAIPFWPDHVTTFVYLPEPEPPEPPQPPTVAEPASVSLLLAFLPFYLLTRQKR